MSTFSPRPYKIQIPQSELDLLRARLSSARWPTSEIIPHSDIEKQPGYNFGPTLEWMRDFAEGWKGFDWREEERMINTLVCRFEERKREGLIWGQIRSF